MLAPYTRLALSEPDNLGVAVTPPDQMAAEFRRAAEIGFPISVHAIGDRANRIVLDIFEEQSASMPPLPMPHRIEHVQTIHPDDIPRLAALDLTASVQPLHAPDDRAAADMYLGPRSRHTYAFASLHTVGARLAFGSDSPVADPNPLLGIHAACFRRRPGEPPGATWYPEETLPLPVAIAAYTTGPAAAGGWAGTIGALRPGLRGDLIVLDRDLFTLAGTAAAGDAGAADAMAGTRVLLTIFDGAIVHESSA
jgi:predicted amidohydrolase YtcJ